MTHGCVSQILRRQERSHSIAIGDSLGSEKIDKGRACYNPRKLTAWRIDLAPGILDVAPQLAPLLRRKARRTLSITALLALKIWASCLPLVAQLLLILSAAFPDSLTKLSSTQRFGLCLRHQQGARKQRRSNATNTTIDHPFDPSNHDPLLHPLVVPR